MKSQQKKNKHVIKMTFLQKIESQIKLVAEKINIYDTELVLREAKAPIWLHNYKKMKKMIKCNKE